MYFMALGIQWLLVKVPVLQELVFVPDSAKAAAAWTSQGASETHLDKVSCDCLTFTPSHVFSYLA